MSQQYDVSQQECSKCLDSGEWGSQWNWTDKLRDRKNSNLCDSETQDNTDMSEAEGRK